LIFAFALYRLSKDFIESWPLGAETHELEPWEQGITNKNKLHHIVYGPTRSEFGLGAQLACCARDKAAEAVRAVRAAPERRDRMTGVLIDKTCPSFRDDGSIRYDANTYTLKSLDRVSLNTLSGRVVGLPSKRFDQSLPNVASSDWQADGTAFKKIRTTLLASSLLPRPNAPDAGLP